LHTIGHNASSALEILWLRAIWNYYRHLRSADIRTCVFPRTNTRFGDIRSSASGPNVEQSAVCTQA